MTIAYKVLGQSNPAATTLTTLYTVPSLTQSVISTLAICNQGATSINVRVAIQPAGASIQPKHYIVYDSYLDPNGTWLLTLGMTLTATDVVSVYAGSATVSFSLFGSELT